MRKEHNQVAGYAGEYIDDRLFLFDNGVYPFMWGIVLTVIGQLARLRHRRLAIVIAAGTALPLLVWKRATVPSLAAGQELFPDAALLSELMAVCAVLLCLALANRHIQRLLHAFFFGRFVPRSPR